MQTPEVGQCPQGTGGGVRAKGSSGRQTREGLIWDYTW